MTGPARAQLFGLVAADVARSEAPPLRGLSDRLALIVDALDRHVAASTGPTPYPWRALGGLRQDLADGYVDAAAVARRLEALAALAAPVAVGPVPLADVVESAVRLVADRIGGKVELLVDLAVTPTVTGDAATLILVVARCVLLAVASASAPVGGSTLSLRSRVDGHEVVLLIVDNGAGNPLVSASAALIATLIAPWRGSFDAAAEDGQGCYLELRLRIAAP